MANSVDADKTAPKEKKKTGGDLTLASGRIFVLHAPGLNELEGIEFFNSLK